MLAICPHCREVIDEKDLIWNTEQTDEFALADLEREDAKIREQVFSEKRGGINYVD